MMDTYKCSSPGKVILAGEHAVVHGYPAIASAINMRMAMQLHMLDEPSYEIKLPDIGVSVHSGSLDSFLLSVLDAFPLFNGVYDLLNEESRESAAARDRDPEKHGFSIVARSGIPVSAGLGSSASTCICLLKSLSTWLGLDIETERLLDLGKTAEKTFHSNPSGIDTAAAVQGGMFLFEGGKIVERIAGPIDLDGDIIIVDTGIQRNTGRMVDLVKRLMARDSNFVQERFDVIGDVVREEWVLLQSRKVDILALGNLFSRNQHELEMLNVSVPTIKDVIDIGTRNGATGGKLTGAGGGGCVILASPSKKTKKIIGALHHWKFRAFKTEFTSKGLECQLIEGDI